MASATGGKAFFPTRIEDMPNSFAEIQDELRSQYALVYKPADFKTDGAFRHDLFVLPGSAVQREGAPGVLRSERVARAPRRAGLNRKLAMGRSADVAMASGHFRWVR